MSADSKKHKEYHLTEAGTAMPQEVEMNSVA
jgi:hypothetical protein